MEEAIEKLLEENRKCYDRFTFDMLRRFIISPGYSREEAKDMILKIFFTF